MTEMSSPAAAAEPPTIDRFSFEQGSINEDDVFFTKKALTPRMVAANCAGGICGGFTGGVSFGIIVLYFAIWFGSLDFNPLQSAFIGLGIFLIVVGIFLTCGCCYGGYRLRAARKARAGSPLGRARSSSEASRRERAVDRRRIKFGVGCCSLLALVALLLFLIPTLPQRYLRLFMMIVFGQAVPRMDAAYCHAYGREQTDQFGGGTVSGQSVRRLQEDASGDVWWLAHGADPASAAKALADQLTEDETLRLLQGIGWSFFSLLPNFYVGSMYGVPRLGIPSINMQDAAQGFRTIDPVNVGKVTQWPCLLNVAATWDANLTERFGMALGYEFKQKGANVILGPSVNVHRIARNGRNAEYMSGEDGHLGAPLAAAYVRGVQMMGVAATVKHFVLNNQEEHRDTESSDASERTLFEVYYPPFEAAVKAGAASAMCSYNVVNGTHACGNHVILNDHLKGTMGFDGFVMSDWWAVHSFDAAVGGVDQNLPGNDLFFSWLTGDHPEEAKGMVERVLRGMIASGAWDNTTCILGCDCAVPMSEVVVTSPEHDELAIEIATSSAVLLQNDDAVLPISNGSIVALVGKGCYDPHELKPDAFWMDGDYYVVGGSGRVLTTSEKAPSIVQRLQTRAGAYSLDLRISQDDSLDGAKRAAEGADVVIACAGSTSSEAVDRASLSVDQESLLNDLGDYLSGGPPLVIALMVPGQTIAPWRSKAKGVVSMFLAGQATGEAWAQILLGEVNPSGKLPVTFPKTEADDPLPPCHETVCTYDERLLVGWKAYTPTSVAYPFGHGLSYTTFSYAWADGGDDNTPIVCTPYRPCPIHVRVTNSGSVAGREVIQLYLTYPSGYGEPELNLRGYRKTPLLQPGESYHAHLWLSEKDVSTWIPRRGGWSHAKNKMLAEWHQAKGTFTVRVGASSAEMRLERTMAYRQLYD